MSDRDCIYFDNGSVAYYNDEKYIYKKENNIIIPVGAYEVSDSIYYSIYDLSNSKLGTFSTVSGILDIKSGRMLVESNIVYETTYRNGGIYSIFNCSPVTAALGTAVHKSSNHHRRPPGPRPGPNKPSGCLLAEKEFWIALLIIVAGIIYIITQTLSFFQNLPDEGMPFLLVCSTLALIGMTVSIIRRSSFAGNFGFSLLFSIIGSPIMSNWVEYSFDHFMDMIATDIGVSLTVSFVTAILGLIIRKIVDAILQKIKVSRITAAYSAARAASTDSSAMLNPVFSDELTHNVVSSATFDNIPDTHISGSDAKLTGLDILIRIIAALLIISAFAILYFYSDQGLFPGTLMLM